MDTCGCEGRDMEISFCMYVCMYVYMYSLAKQCDCGEDGYRLALKVW